MLVFTEHSGAHCIHARVPQRGQQRDGGSEGGHARTREEEESGEDVPNKAAQV